MHGPGFIIPTSPRGKFWGQNLPFIRKQAHDKPHIPCNPSCCAAGAPSKAASSWKSASPNKLIIETGTNGTIKGREKKIKKEKKNTKKEEKAFAFQEIHYLAAKISPRLSFSRSCFLSGIFEPLEELSSQDTPVALLCKPSTFP